MSCKVDPAGKITTFRGGLTTGAGDCATATDNFGDGCPANESFLRSPYGIAIDPTGAIYVAENFSHPAASARSDLPTYTITSVVDPAGTSGSTDGALPTAGLLKSPRGIAVDKPAISTSWTRELRPSPGELQHRTTHHHRERRQGQGHSHHLRSRRCIRRHHSQSGQPGSCERHCLRQQRQPLHSRRYLPLRVQGQAESGNRNGRREFHHDRRHGVRGRHTLSHDLHQSAGHHSEHHSLRRGGRPPGQSVCRRARATMFGSGTTRPAYTIFRRRHPRKLLRVPGIRNSPANGCDGNDSALSTTKGTGGLALDAWGNLYITDSASSYVHKLSLGTNAPTASTPARGIRIRRAYRRERYLFQHQHGLSSGLHLCPAGRAASILHNHSTWRQHAGLHVPDHQHRPRPTLSMSK